MKSNLISLKMYYYQKKNKVKKGGGIYLIPLSVLLHLM